MTSGLSSAVSGLLALLLLPSCAATMGQMLTPSQPLVDPTPLAKCRVAANASSPLVTEWPASEKAHLQSLAASQTVAVEYSGCELRVVDACKLDGHYQWQQTTLATDTVEIQNDDELYAKLPIGALNLEGELKRSGRIAVRTSVAGQLKAGDISTSDVPREGPCARATHFVSAISIGAFKLLSGGATNAKVGATVMSTGASVSASHDEQVMREAGDPSQCASATSKEPSAACASPIQVFLTPIDRKKTDVEVKTDREQHDAEMNGGVRVAFASPNSKEPWSLRDSNGIFQCTLPCARWVPPDSGYFLYKSAPRVADTREIKVSNDLGFSPGQSVSGEYAPAEGSRTISGTVAGVGTAAAVVGLFLIIADLNSLHTCTYNFGGGPTSTERAQKSCDPKFGIVSDQRETTTATAGIITAGAGVALLALASYLFLHTHPAHYKYSTASSSPSTRPTFMLLPGGVRGSF